MYNNNMFSNMFNNMGMTNIVDSTFISIAHKTIMDMGYNPGDPAGPLLKEIAELYLGISSIKELWGPLWALPITIMADRIHPSLNFETRLGAIIDVVGQMEGRTSITPNVISARRTGQTYNPMPTNDYQVIDKIKSYISTATRVCKYLDIPSPIEVTLLYKSIGKDVSPIDAEDLWRSEPEKYKLSTEIVDGCMDSLFDVLWPNPGYATTYDYESEMARNLSL